MRKDEAKHWFDKAKHDLAAGNFLLKDDGFTDTICFFAHQVVEKALKGTLTLHDIKPDRTHNLITLADEAEKYLPEINEHQNEIESLNDYYIPSRYPVDPPVDYSKEDAESALQNARKILKLLSDF